MNYFVGISLKDAFLCGVIIDPPARSRVIIHVIKDGVSKLDKVVPSAGFTWYFIKSHAAKAIRNNDPNSIAK